MTQRDRRSTSGKTGDDEPVAISEAITRLRSDWGLPDPTVFDALVGRWAELVGGNIAAHAHPQSLRNDVLLVEVDDTPWATEMRYLEAQLRDRMEQLLGTPGFREMRVVVVRRTSS